MELKQLKNLRSLRAALDNCSESDVETIIEKLCSVKQEIHNKSEQILLEEAKKNEALQKILNSLHEHNLGVEDLVAFSKGSSKKKNKPDRRSNPKPKYKYIDVNGVERFWTGRGKIPSQMQEVMSRDGHVKDFYQIKD